MAGSEAREGRRAKPQFSAIIDIERPPEDVWRTIAPPERWFELYPQTRSRSHHYPAPDTRDAHPYRTRRSEEVGAHVTRSEASTVLEEDQEGRTFARHVRHRLSPSLTGTTVRVQDEIRFTGSAKPAAPIASRDIKRRWETSANARRQPPSAGRSPTTGRSTGGGHEGAGDSLVTFQAQSLEAAGAVLDDVLARARERNDVYRGRVELRARPATAP